MTVRLFILLFIFFLCGTVVEAGEKAQDKISAFDSLLPVQKGAEAKLSPQEIIMQVQVESLMELAADQKKEIDALHNSVEKVFSFVEAVAKQLDSLQNYVDALAKDHEGLRAAHNGFVKAIVEVRAKDRQELGALLISITGGVNQLDGAIISPTNDGTGNYILLP